MSRHGKPLRGLENSTRSSQFEGVFGRMFRSLKPAKYGADLAETKKNLGILAGAMTAGFDEPKDGTDDEESGIPSLYTYLGQFIDHDLTFDPSSSLQKQNDPDALVDFRTPAFDLDNVYGRGPDDQPYMYATPKTFLLGDPIGGGGNPATDLPRNAANPRRALIGDPRNDENVIVSQLQGLFHRFHNRVVDENPILSFEDAQRVVRHHYQYVVANDFLPRIVHAHVINLLKSEGHYDKSKLKYYHFRNRPFMPVEFSGAAYRLGHSMVRPGYRLNDADATLLPIFPVLPKFPEGLTGFREMNKAWGIDWARFIDTEIRDTDAPGDIKKRLQFAYRLDTSAVNPLGDMPLSVAETGPTSLPLRNLERSVALELPNGQSVAKAMKLKPLKDSEILIGKYTGKPADTAALVPIDKIAGDAFKHNCPLWTYILAETRKYQVVVKLPVKENVSLSTPQLGPVGGRIVAEVFLGILFGDPHSYLSQEPEWHPAAGADYALKDFVNYALGK